MDAISKHLYEREEIILAYVYGSLARGTENKMSDIDIAIYIDKDKKPDSGPFGYRSELITELESLVDREVDLVILNDVPQLLAFNVLKEGRLLFTKSEKKRVQLHDSIMKKYLDFLPARSVQEKYLKKRIANFGR